MYILKRKFHFMCSILLFILAVQQVSAQSNSKNKNKEKLIGTWSLDYNKTIKNAQQKSREYYGTLKSERKNRLKNSFSQRKMIFSPKGSYTLIINSNKKEIGTWRLKDDNITIEIRLGKIIFLHKLEKLSNSKMVLNIVDKSSSSKRLFEKWYLNKTD